MDLLKTLERRKEGFISSQKYNRFMEYELLKKVHSDQRHGVYQTKFSAQGADFSLYKNRLLVAHTNLRVSLYDVTKPIRSGYKCLKVCSIRSTVRSGLECICWNSDGEFFTYSAKDKHLYCIDTEEMQEIERIKIKGAKRIFQHQPSPHSSEMVAVASPLPEVIIADLRSGNLTSTSPFHPRGVLSVSWSGLHENLLATAGDNGVIFWDIRHFRRPMYVNVDNCDIPGVLPYFEMVPYTDKLILLNSDRSLTVWDAHRLVKNSHYGPFESLPFNRRARYKFALSGTSEPGLIFMPENHNVGVYDYNNMTLICSLQLGHVMPAQVLCFNNHMNQLYSSSRDGTIAWVPKSLLWGQCWANFFNA